MMTSKARIRDEKTMHTCQLLLRDAHMQMLTCSCSAPPCSAHVSGRSQGDRACGAEASEGHCNTEGSIQVCCSCVPCVMTHVPCVMHASSLGLLKHIMHTMPGTRLQLPCSTPPKLCQALHTCIITVCMGLPGGQGFAMVCRG